MSPSREQAQFRAERTAAKHKLHGERRAAAITNAVHYWEIRSWSLAGQRRPPLLGSRLVRDVLVGAAAVVLGNVISNGLSGVAGYNAAPATDDKPRGLLGGIFDFGSSSK